jgi:hypothetical protein
MNTETLNIDTQGIKNFISENRLVIAAIGGVVVGIAVASLLGNERAKQLLRTMGSTVTDATERFVNNLGGYKQMAAPLLGKTEAQGL